MEEGGGHICMLDPFPVLTDPFCVP
jgi:hypothetical protein